MQTQASHTDTKEALIESAEKLFAESGYDSVSVRRITSDAGCHLSAVNYHFGSKRNLYREVFLQRWIPRAERGWKPLDDASRSGGLTPPQMIRLMAHGFLSSFSSQQDRVRHLQLVTRELAKPGVVFQGIIKEHLRPRFIKMATLLSPHLEGSCTTEELHLSLYSIMAQIIHFTMAQQAIEASVGRKYDDEFMVNIVDHIVHFSLNGLKLKTKSGTR